VSRPDPDRVAEFRKEAGLDDDERLVLFVGRLADEKRSEWVTRLAAELGPDEARVGIIGDGPLREDVAKAVRANDRLIWISELDAVEPAIVAADLVVLPSKIEGIPLVAMEALALGTPVVATRVGGLPDLEDEKGMTLTDPEDFDAFLEAVRKGLDVDSGRAHLSKRFSAKEMLEHYDRLLFDPR
jgi:glycosyltransferase involved in cell wall biosynthesis